MRRENWDRDTNAGRFPVPLANNSFESSFWLIVTHTVWEEDKAKSHKTQGENKGEREGGGDDGARSSKLSTRISFLPKFRYVLPFLQHVQIPIEPIGLVG